VNTSGPPLAAATALTLAGLLLAKAALLADNRYPLMERLLPVVREHAAGGAIAFLSTTTWTGFPLALYGNVGWASRFPTLWLLPGVERARRDWTAETDLALLAEIERFTTDAVVADLAAGHPALVVVDARPRKPCSATCRSTSSPTSRPIRACRAVGRRRAYRRNRRLRDLPPASIDGTRTVELDLEAEHKKAPRLAVRVEVEGFVDAALKRLVHHEVERAQMIERETLHGPLQQLRKLRLEPLGRELRLDCVIVLGLVGVDRDVRPVALVARARMRNLAQHHPPHHGDTYATVIASPFRTTPSTRTAA
jgi:hypothetical protein